MIQNLYGDGRTSVTEESYYEMTDLKGNKLDDGKVIVIWKNTKDVWKMHGTCSAVIILQNQTKTNINSLLEISVVFDQRMSGCRRVMP